jgi:hypothetical protein
VPGDVLVHLRVGERADLALALLVPLDYLELMLGGDSLARTLALQRGGLHASRIHKS